MHLKNEEINTTNFGSTDICIYCVYCLPFISCLLFHSGNDIAVDPEKFFNANFAKKNDFHEKYSKLFVKLALTPQGSDRAAISLPDFSIKVVGVIKNYAIFALDFPLKSQV